MAQKTVDIEVSAIYSFTYDPESPEFKEAFDRYRKRIDKSGNEEGMITHVAEGIHSHQTASQPINAVGFVQVQGGGTPPRFSGITVEDDNPDFNYEIL